MTDNKKKALVPTIEGFRMPTFDQIPTVGLYLEQATTFLNEYLEPLNGTQLTSSMISNYVKKHLIESPVKKQYSQEQLAYLFFIAISKTVLPLADLKVLVEIQRRTYPTRRAYEYFTEELDNALRYVFGIQESLRKIGQDRTEEKRMLDNIIMTAAHKIYLEKYFALLHEQIDG
ncbi:DUF1836 domain-containing protein [Ligilactobacillus sp.]|uniref:DUF1836 domain-containing protein n=1 Tax=Ligilactobacillus sp. TaxID=2767921 RepID=UPI002FE42177